MLPSDQSNVQPNTLVALVCGGLAASTAVLFTTPFDVVKTRYQAQGFDSKVGDVYDSRSTLLCITRIFQEVIFFGGSPTESSTNPARMKRWRRFIGFTCLSYGMICTERM